MSSLYKLDVHVIISILVTLNVYDCIRLPQKSSMGRHLRAVRNSVVVKLISQQLLESMNVRPIGTVVVDRHGSCFV
jgi:hypothetical protein